MNRLHYASGLNVTYGLIVLRDSARSKCQFHKAHARITTKRSLDIATGATQRLCGSYGYRTLSSQLAWYNKGFTSGMVAANLEKGAEKTRLGV